MEVVRDKADNCIIVCSIENIDPMGVHTGDSITVAPALTLTDKEYQMMRNASIAVLREIGVETGGSNVQFAVNPADGRLVVIEMNPRVSRSSALASKATGFPIAKVAAKLAVGYTLDELDNDITGGATPASFEPIDRLCRHQDPALRLREVPRRRAVLTTAMKSVGEVMAIGRTFAGIAAEGAARPRDRPDRPRRDRDPRPRPRRRRRPATPSAPPSARRRRTACAWSPRRCASASALEDVHAGCKIDPWFLEQIAGIVDMEARVREHGLPDDAGNLRMLKAMGFSDARLASLAGASAEATSPKLREQLDVRPVFKRIDTCAAEFASPTAYMYSTYEAPFAGAARRRGAGLRSQEGRHPRRRPEPHRPGHRVRLLLLPRRLRAARRRLRSHHDQLQPGDRLDRLRHLRPALFRAADGRGRARRSCAPSRPTATLLGVIVQFGGQTPLKLADALEKAGIPILGTSPDTIDLAEDRDRFQKLLTSSDLTQPKNGIAYSVEQARLVAGELGFPLVVRPSYVLGGRAMQIIHDEGMLQSLPARHRARPRAGGHQAAIPQRQDRPDQHAARQEPAAVRHLSQPTPSRSTSTASATATTSSSAGIMEHIEEAGIHSGDSACSLPVALAVGRDSSTSWSARRRRWPSRSMSAA